MQYTFEQLKQITNKRCPLCGGEFVYHDNGYDGKAWYSCYNRPNCNYSIKYHNFKDIEIDFLKNQSR